MKKVFILSLLSFASFATAATKTQINLEKNFATAHISKEDSEHLLELKGGELLLENSFLSMTCKESCRIFLDLNKIPEDSELSLSSDSLYFHIKGQKAAEILSQLKQSLTFESSDDKVFLESFQYQEQVFFNLYIHKN